MEFRSSEGELLSQFRLSEAQRYAIISLERRVQTMYFSFERRTWCYKLRLNELKAVKSVSPERSIVAEAQNETAGGKGSHNIWIL